MKKKKQIGVLGRPIRNFIKNQCYHLQGNLELLPYFKILENYLFMLIETNFFLFKNVNIFQRKYFFDLQLNNFSEANLPVAMTHFVFVPSLHSNWTNACVSCVILSKINS